MSTKSGNSYSELLGKINEVNLKVKNMERILMGNGTEGLMRKMEESSEAIIKIQSYNHIKTWVLGGAVSFLLAMLTALTTLYWIKVQ